MDEIEKLLMEIKNYTVPQSAQELEEAIKKAAIETFYSSLDILINQKSHSEEDINTAIIINAALMPHRFWMTLECYYSEMGIEKLKQIKQLLDANKEN